MSEHELVFLGEAAATRRPRAELRHEGRVLETGTALRLVRVRSPWKPGRSVERVIVGSHDARADLRLEGDGIHPEHARFYIDVAGGTIDLRPLHPNSMRVDNRPLEPLEWVPLRGGETIELGGWRFRLRAFPADRSADLPCR